jgi:hypothetical protein
MEEHDAWVPVELAELESGAVASDLCLSCGGDASLVGCALLASPVWAGGYTPDEAFNEWTPYLLGLALSLVPFRLAMDNWQRKDRGGFVEEAGQEGERLLLRLRDPQTAAKIRQAVGR